MVIDCAGKGLDLTNPRVMGILNVTPDSFSDGGKYLHIDAALVQARRMVEEGAAIIDIGGESTRPGAKPVSIEEEIQRVVPVIEALAPQIPVPISIDTSKPEVMRAAVTAGAGLVNDVCALGQPGAVEAVVELGVPVSLMHMLGEPRTMQQSPSYYDVVSEVIDFLQQRVDDLIAAGIDREKIIVDPGFGFGKTLEHNLILLRELPRLHTIGAALLVGLSRKSMIAKVLDSADDERIYGSVATTTLAAWLGADLIRVHDVRASIDAIKMALAVRGAGQHQES